MRTLDRETGLLASLHFEEELRKQFLETLSQGQPYAVVACSPQQLPGERLPEVAKAAAACVRSLVRESDIAGRLEDDTLVIGLPDTEASGARVLAHRLKSELGLKTARLGSTKWQAGFASTPEDGLTPDELLAAAIEHAKDSTRLLTR